MKVTRPAMLAAHTASLELDRGREDAGKERDKLGVWVSVGIGGKWPR